jgi:hypothetical protein
MLQSCWNTHSQGAPWPKMSHNVAHGHQDIYNISSFLISAYCPPQYPYPIIPPLVRVYKRIKYTLLNQAFLVHVVRMALPRTRNNKWECSELKSLSMNATNQKSSWGMQRTKNFLGERSLRTEWTKRLNVIHHLLSK